MTKGEIVGGYVFTTTGRADICVEELSRDNDVLLKISGAFDDSAYFDVNSLKELRKFLKKLQKQLEGNA